MLFVYFSGHSQEYASNWILGDFGLEFQEDTVMVRQDYAAFRNLGCGIISDEDGDLLFYTDGFTVWNSQHDTMPNGQNLLTNHLQHSIYESLVVRWPGSESLFLIFTADPFNGQEESGLYYSVVDLSLDGGLGDVSSKGLKLMDTVSNKLTAVYHQNRSDVWLITHAYNTNEYHAYLVTDAGIGGTPVISEAGPDLGSSFYGQLKASPDGRWLACSHEAVNDNHFVLFDFDDLTGSLSNALSFPLPETIRAADGIEFSPDATRLLVYQTGSTGESGLYQFDLSNPVYEDILASRTLLIQEQYNSFMQMQLAQDGRIYITKGGGGGGTGHLGVVHNPNDLGPACIVTENGLNLNGANSFVARTPNFNQSYFFRTDFRVDSPCQSSPVSFNITNGNRLDSVRWHFGEGSTSTAPDPVFEYALSGEYQVQLWAYYPDRTDTISKVLSVYPKPEFDLGNDTTACPGITIGVEEQFDSYSWNTGESSHEISVDVAGSYVLSVENSYGCIARDTIEISLHDLPLPMLPDTMDLDGQDSVQLDAGDFDLYEWNTGDTTRSIYATHTGWYSVYVENEFECGNASSIYVKDGTLPDNPQGRTGWEILNPKPSVQAGRDICFTDDQNGFIISENDLLRTRDGGENWEWQMELSSGRHLAFKNSIGYIVGAGGAIYKSTHNGDGWNKVEAGFTDDLNSVTIIHPDTVLITGDQNLFITFDGGTSWLTRAVTGVDIQASYFTSALTGHVACREGTIMKTINGGLNWYITEDVSHTPSDFFDIYFINPQLGFASRQHSDLLRTSNGGESWEEVEDYLEAAYDIYFLNEDLGFVAGSDGAVFKTTDGGINWDRTGNQPLTDGTDIYGIYFLSEDQGLAVGEGGRIIHTTDAGASWENYAPTYYTIHQVAHTSPHTLYALGEKVFKSTDGGQHWDTLHTGVYDFDRYIFVYKEGHFLSADEFYVIASAGEISKVIKSTDGGQHFEILQSDGKDIRATSIHFLDSQTGYVCNSYDSGGSGLYKTSDGGSTWEYLSAYRFRDIWFVNEDAGFAILSDLLYQTTDGGLSWEQKLRAEHDLTEIAFANDLVGYISGDQGLVLKTTDQGLNWQHLFTGHYTDNYGLAFYDQHIGYVCGEYQSVHFTENGGITWETEYLPASVRSVALSAYKEVFIAGAQGVILKNTFEAEDVSVTLLEVEGQTHEQAVLKAYITTSLAPISEIYFDYGPGDQFSYSIEAAPDNIGTGASGYAEAAIAGLLADTDYSFRLRWTYQDAGHYSDTLFFRTLSATGLQAESERTPDVDLFPNPASEMLHLVSDVPLETIQVFDMHGLLLISEEFQPRVDISALEPGMYLIRISAKSGSVIQRFVKQ